MHAARIKHSQRLQRLDNLLADGRAYTTRELFELVGICAVNSAIAELRANGREIRCWREGDLFYYQRSDLAHE